MKLSEKNIYIKLHALLKKRIIIYQKFPFKRKVIILGSYFINYRDQQKEKKELNENLPKEDFILSIGRLTKQKNFSFLLNAFLN